MVRYLARRLLGLTAVLVLVLTLVFFMLHASPGGPENAYLGNNPTPEKRAAVMAQLGLDQPLLTQYWQFVGSMFTFDFGNSLTTNRPVSEMLMQRIPITLELGLDVVRPLDRSSDCWSAPSPPPARVASSTAWSVSAASWRSRCPASGSAWSSCSPSVSTSPGSCPAPAGSPSPRTRSAT